MFRVVDSLSATSGGNEVLLVKDNWNDWFTWVTQFYIVVVHRDGARTDVGQVKIANTAMTPQNAVTHAQIHEPFSHLGEGWFSLGQSENYYETLNSLGAEYRDWFLNALRDCAKDLALFDRHAQEEVFRRSLMRDIDPERVRNRFHRLAQGDAALTNFAFRFRFPEDPRALTEPPTLTFKVTPGSKPPTNVHVVIGRNGVGKSRCFDLLSRAFLGLEAPDGGPAGELGPLEIATVDFLRKSHGFAGLVTVAFSPFDKYGPLVKGKTNLQVRYDYVGLIRESAEERPPSADPDADIAPLTIKSQPELTTDFLEGIKACRSGARRARWARALQVLEADPLFKEASISGVVDDEAGGWEARARRLFRNLSSGHSIVLLIITKLIELVEEKSLVLIDEPEGHLHPPLLSAFVRALSDLLNNRNGVAIIATHSPVVLQEVPKSCTWILNRSGRSARADRPLQETFGENVGVLTHHVFGLEVVQTGFYRMISDAVGADGYDAVRAEFDDRLGGEARALARALSLVPPGGLDDEVEDL
jgi:hypothetical protein